MHVSWLTAALFTVCLSLLAASVTIVTLAVLANPDGFAPVPIICEEAR